MTTGSNSDSSLSGAAGGGGEFDGYIARFVLQELKNMQRVELRFRFALPVDDAVRLNAAVDEDQECGFGGAFHRGKFP